MLPWDLLKPVADRAAVMSNEQNFRHGGSEERRKVQIVERRGLTRDEKARGESSVLRMDRTRRIFSTISLGQLQSCRFTAEKRRRSRAGENKCSILPLRITSNEGGHSHLAFSCWIELYKCDTCQHAPSYKLLVHLSLDANPVAISYLHVKSLISVETGLR